MDDFANFFLFAHRFEIVQTLLYLIMIISIDHAVNLWRTHHKNIKWQKEVGISRTRTHCVYISYKLKSSNSFGQTNTPTKSIYTHPLVVSLWFMLSCNRFVTLFGRRKSSTLLVFVFNRFLLFLLLLLLVLLQRIQKKPNEKHRHGHPMNTAVSNYSFNAHS